MAALSKEKMINQFGFRLCEQLAGLDQQGFTVRQIKKQVMSAKDMTTGQVRKCIEAFYDRVQS